jgi:hypothetical protein
LVVAVQDVVGFRDNFFSLFFGIVLKGKLFLLYKLHLSQNVDVFAFIHIFHHLSSPSIYL